MIREAPKLAPKKFGLFGWETMQNMAILLSVVFSSGILFNKVDSLERRVDAYSEGARLDHDDVVRLKMRVFDEKPLPTR